MALRKGSAMLSHGKVCAAQKTAFVTLFMRADLTTHLSIPLQGVLYPFELLPQIRLEFQVECEGFARCLGLGPLQEHGGLALPL